MEYKTLQNQIATCRAYEGNGLPEFLKQGIRGSRRELEQRLDRARAGARETYREANWN